jgi:2,4-dienoyl-CoA reductase-like NADH-dependent reductase (Old Yellow Enzyme family)
MACCSFASPFFNRRSDRTAAHSRIGCGFRSRSLEAIKKQTGDTFPVGVRICLNEFTTFGYDLDYGLRRAEALETSGLVDYFNADAGSFSSYWIEIPPAAVAPTEFRKLNAGLKRTSRLPVIAFGRITPPQRGEDMLRAGEADLIGMARQLITDPETPNNLRPAVDLVCAYVSPAMTPASTR